MHLLRSTAQFAGAPVVRSRDPAQLERADVVVDVGGVFDAASLKFDHHQRGFDRAFLAGARRPFLVVSCGFDPHFLDPTAQFNLDASDFHR